LYFHCLHLWSRQNGSALDSINRGDFNEDGIPDALFLTFSGVEVGLSDSQGNLTFLTSSGSISSDGTTSDSDSTVAKFTSSGHLDVATTRSNFQAVQPVDILLGHGDGTFE